jgi:hypothetical protein
MKANDPKIQFVSGIRNYLETLVNVTVVYFDVC